jgi:hypothetical protein
MSIYATLWRLQFPRDDDAYTGCYRFDTGQQAG